MVNQTTSKKRLPLWANLLICVVVTVIVGVTYSAFEFFMLVRQISIDATIPEKMAANARQIANFPEPLPAGYHYLMAADLIYMTLLVVEHDPDKQQIAFYCLKGMLPQEQDAKSLLDRAYDVGINTVYTSAKFHELKGHGTEKIAAQQMPYLIGQFTDQTERKADGFVGCICLNKAAKNILIYSYPDRHNAYNQQVTMDLLRSIKGF